MRPADVPDAYDSTPTWLVSCARTRMQIQGAMGNGFTFNSIGESASSRQALICRWEQKLSQEQTFGVKLREMGWG